MTIVDAHLHVWNLERHEYDWPTPDLPELYRTMDVDDVRASLDRAGVDAVVLVQAADTADDTAGMLEMADRHPIVAGVVGWVPLDRPVDAAAALDAFASDPRIVGIRNLIHTQADPNWILRPDVNEGLGLLADAGLPFDYVTSGPGALAHLPELARRHPSLQFVLDHLGKPPIGLDHAARRAWRDLLESAAQNPLLSAKVSGLASAIGRPDSWTTEMLRPFIHDALELFGADRLMYGGDWPVSILAGGYDRNWDGVSEVLGELSEGERTAVLGGTATRVYGLSVSR
jgi:L-fuconolactonase